MSLFSNKWVLGGFALLAFLVVIFVARYDAYHDGVRDTDAAYKAASDRLIAKAQKSANSADLSAVRREVEHASQLQQEKAKVDEAIANGSSPIDALFPSGVQH